MFSETKGNEKAYAISELVYSDIGLAHSTKLTHNVITKKGLKYVTSNLGLLVDFGGSSQ